MSRAMRFIRYRDQDAVSYGVLEGTEISQIDTTPFDAWKTTGAKTDIGSVKVLVPVVPSTFYAIGMNYRHHAAVYGTPGAAEPSRPQPGYRANSALIAHDEAIVIPHQSSGIQYEGELVVVIGKTGRYISERDALSIVLGYSIGNDVSERTWQKADAGLWRAKNADTFKPMGPWIETDVDLPSLVTRVRVNGEQKVEFRTNEMIFGVETYIAEITKYMTLHPGDVIWMGTEGSESDLRAGDICEIELDQIGTLRNPVSAEERGTS
jgi:2-keto-4-pentenoate hydratase/2-oxohepta-3-ene-1,7-dioic acid hydratase in catechol pathway